MSHSISKYMEFFLASLVKFHRKIFFFALDLNCAEILKKMENLVTPSNNNKTSYNIPLESLPCV